MCIVLYCLISVLLDLLPFNLQNSSSNLCQVRVTVGDSKISCVVLAFLKRRLIRFLCLFFDHLVFMYLFIYYSIIYRFIYFI